MANFGAFGVALAADRHFDLPALLAATATDVFLVLQHGRIIHESYGDGLDAETPHLLMSMAMAVTGLVVSVLAEPEHSTSTRPSRRSFPGSPTPPGVARPCAIS